MNETGGLALNPEAGSKVHQVASQKTGTPIFIVMQNGCYNMLSNP